MNGINEIYATIWKKIIQNPKLHCAFERHSIWLLVPQKNIGQIAFCRHLLPVLSTPQMIWTLCVTLVDTVGTFHLENPKPSILSSSEKHLDESVECLQRDSNKSGPGINIESNLRIGSNLSIIDYHCIILIATSSWIWIRLRLWLSIYANAKQVPSKAL